MLQDLLQTHAAFSQAGSGLDCSSDLSEKLRQESTSQLRNELRKEQSIKKMAKGVAVALHSVAMGCLWDQT